MERSVYERIVDQNNTNTNISLKENQFSMRGKNIAFIDGMVDRMSFLRKHIPDDHLTEVKGVLEEAAHGEVEKAFQDLKKTPVHNVERWINILDGIDSYLKENADVLSTEGMRAFVRLLLLKSPVLEEVKMALSLYEKLLNNDPETDEVILNYAKSAEFSALAMPLVKRMKNGNQLLFEIAKDSSGGAKVTATELLEPETEEIEDWLFREGTDPFLSYYHSSVPISKKCNLPARMKDPNLTDDDYYIICRIVYGYYEEGFAVGLKTLNQWPILESFFELCSTRIRPFMIETLTKILDVIQYHLDRPDNNTLTPEEIYCRLKCKELLFSDEIRHEIQDHVNQGEWISCGDAINILNDDLVLNAIRKHPVENAQCIEYLVKDESKKDAVKVYLDQPFRDTLFSDSQTMYRTSMYILRLLDETKIIDEPYICALLDENRFPFSMYAAELVLRLSEEGNIISDDLLQKTKKLF